MRVPAKKKTTTGRGAKRDVAVPVVSLVSAAEIAERVGLKRQIRLSVRVSFPPSFTIARLEAGGVNPSLDTLPRVADAVGLELVVEFRPADAA